MVFNSLKKQVCDANLELVRRGLVIYTWGNVSGADRERGVFAIKPSGVEYADLTPDAIIVLSLVDGSVIEGSLRPSSDTPTHLRLYQAFPTVSGICHTHSHKATAFAQSLRPLPCLGTTHADYFHGAVPLTRRLTDEEISGDYEANTGSAIAELWKGKEGDALHTPGALVACHGPFTWGSDPGRAVEAAVVLEQLAAMAIDSLSVNPFLQPIAQTLLDKHFLRKHGTGAYYGQAQNGRGGKTD